MPEPTKTSLEELFPSYMVESAQDVLQWLNGSSPKEIVKILEAGLHFGSFELLDDSTKVKFNVVYFYYLNSADLGARVRSLCPKPGGFFTELADLLMESEVKGAYLLGFDIFLGYPFEYDYSRDSDSFIKKLTATLATSPHLEEVVSIALGSLVLRESNFVRRCLEVVLAGLLSTRQPQP